MSRYILAAGFAASEVAALMVFFGIIGFFTGAKSAGILFDAFLIAALGAWLWWKRSVIAASVMFLSVLFEYCYLAYATGQSNTWLTTYVTLFLIGFVAHVQRQPKVEPEAASVPK